LQRFLCARAETPLGLPKAGEDWRDVWRNDAVPAPAESAGGGGNERDAAGASLSRAACALSQAKQHALRTGLLTRPRPRRRSAAGARRRRRKRRRQ
jgi:hypothetical protein